MSELPILPPYYLSIFNFHSIISKNTKNTTNRILFMCSILYFIYMIITFTELYYERKNIAKSFWHVLDSFMHENQLTDKPRILIICKCTMVIVEILVLEHQNGSQRSTLQCFFFLAISWFLCFELRYGELCTMSCLALECQLPNNDMKAVYWLENFGLSLGLFQTIS